MTNIVKKIFFLSILSFNICSLTIVSGNSHAEVSSPLVLEWITKGNLVLEENIFIRSFLEAYKDFSEDLLGIKQNKAEWLREAFKQEQEELNEGIPEIFFVSAKKDSKIVGFASFNRTKNPDEVYIRQLAVDSTYWHQGIGKKLVFSIGEKIEGIKKYVLVTRRINTIAKRFYEKLGFKECEYTHEGLDPKKYVGYELTITKK